MAARNSYHIWRMHFAFGWYFIGRWGRCLAMILLRSFATHQWLIVNVHHQSVFSPHLNCLVFEVRESIKATKRAWTLLLLKTGCKSGCLYCHFTHPNDSRHFNWQRRDKKTVLSIHFWCLARVEKPEAAFIMRQNKTLMACLIFVLPGGACSGMHFFLGLPILCFASAECCGRSHREAIY